MSSLPLLLYLYTSKTNSSSVFLVPCRAPSLQLTYMVANELFLELIMDLSYDWKMMFQFGPSIVGWGMRSRALLISVWRLHPVQNLKNLCTVSLDPMVIEPGSFGFGFGFGWAVTRSLRGCDDSHFVLIPIEESYDDILCTFIILYSPLIIKNGNGGEMSWRFHRCNSEDIFLQKISFGHTHWRTLSDSACEWKDDDDNTTTPGLSFFTCKSNLVITFSRHLTYEIAKLLLLLW